MGQEAGREVALIRSLFPRREAHSRLGVRLVHLATVAHREPVVRLLSAVQRALVAALVQPLQTMPATLALRLRGRRELGRAETTLAPRECGTVRVPSPFRVTATAPLPYAAMARRTRQLVRRAMSWPVWIRPSATE